MKIAVLTLTRDRLDYTKHCFETLRDNAGCDFDHYVWDNGSTDGTAGWLAGEEEDGRLHCVVTSRDNIGISAAMNALLRIIDRDETDYDVIAKIDNDCELLTPDTLRDVCELVHDYGLLLSPQILGLRNPPATIGNAPLKLGDVLVDQKAQIGGVFLAAPASLYHDFRYSETNPAWGNDDVEVCAYWRDRGGMCGYVHGYEAAHYLTTDGQWADQPAYFARTQAEGKAVL